MTQAEAALRIDTLNVEKMRAALARIDSFQHQYTDAEALAHLLVDLEEFKRNLLDTLDTMHENLNVLLKDKETEIEGVGTVTKYTTSTTKWDHGRILMLIHRAAADPETGEIDHRRVTEIVGRASAIAYWRIGALRQDGIELDEDCRDKVWGRKRVKIDRNDPAPGEAGSPDPMVASETPSTPEPGSPDE